MRVFILVSSFAPFVALGLLLTPVSKDALTKGRAEEFSKHVGQFTLLVSEAHSRCPKCGADTSIKANVRSAALAGVKVHLTSFAG